jgi:hypothetical protein
MDGGHTAPCLACSLAQKDGCPQVFSVHTRPKKKQLEVSEKRNFEAWVNHFVKLNWLFCKTNFFRRIPFHSVPSLGIGSSAELRISWKEHFIPRNNGNGSESCKFLQTKFRS